MLDATRPALANLLLALAALALAPGVALADDDEDASEPEVSSETTAPTPDAPPSPLVVAACKNAAALVQGGGSGAVDDTHLKLCYRDLSYFAALCHDGDATLSCMALAKTHEDIVLCVQGCEQP